MQALLDLGKSAGLPVSSHRVGTMMSLIFTPEPPSNYETMRRADTELYARFFHSLLEQGVYLAPSQFEAAFTSSAHDDRALEITIQAASRAFESLR